MSIKFNRIKRLKFHIRSIEQTNMNERRRVGVDWFEVTPRLIYSCDFTYRLCIYLLSHAKLAVGHWEIWASPGAILETRILEGATRGKIRRGDGVQKGALERVSECSIWAKVNTRAENKISFVAYSMSKL